LTAARSVVLRQNAARPAPVPRTVIDRLADRLEPPTALEAHAVQLVG
jgi:tRNA uridine 5-carbamoylmethylation protein Kti12